MLKNLFWKRLLAGFFDFTALYALILGLSSYFFVENIVLAALVTLPVYLLINAALFALVKTTLGHALLGVQLTGTRGNRLSYLMALKSFFVKKYDFVWKTRALKWPMRTLSALVLLFLVSSFPLKGRFQEVRTAFLQHVLMSGWVQYNSADGRFSIHFPCSPKVEATEIPLEDSNQSLYINEFVSKPEKGLSYSISYTDLPSKWTAFGSRILLKETLKVLLENHPGLNLLNQEFKVYSGYRVLDYQAVKGKELIEGRLILVGNKLYKLAVAHPKDSSHDDQIEQFMSSLKI